MWNGTLVMISFAGMGDADGDGDVSTGGDGDSTGVAEGLVAAVVGLSSGEGVGASAVGTRVQLVAIRSRAATRVTKTAGRLSTTHSSPETLCCPVTWC
jgi:hypothetical protein